MLYCEVKRVEVSSVVIGEWIFSGWIESMGLVESDIIDIRPVSSR